MNESPYMYNSWKDYSMAVGSRGIKTIQAISGHAKTWWISPPQHGAKVSGPDPGSKNEWNGSGFDGANQTATEKCGDIP